jgi:hypothetical protein
LSATDLPPCTPNVEKQSLINLCKTVYSTEEVLFQIVSSLPVEFKK